MASNFPRIALLISAVVRLAGLLATVPLGAAPATEGPVPPNLVLITLDTARADHLGCYGWGWAHTPNLDRLAARGVRFASCDTAAPLTLPSHATILTGLLPPRHGVRDNGIFVLSDRLDTVAEILTRHGFDTAAAVSAAVLARSYGLAQGFRLYDDDRGAGDTAGTMIAERDATLTTEAAIHALASLRQPFFLWVHYFDPHEEYRPPTRIAATMAGPHRLYDGEIAFMDEGIGRLLGALPPRCVIVAVGDHGEMLGEHGERAHGLLPLRGARRVPLIVNGPGLPAGKVVDCLVRTADVMPTLLGLAALATPAGLDGESLLALLTDGAKCDRVSYCESFEPYFFYRFFPLRTLGNDSWLYLQGPRTGSLYDLRSDPDETRDQAAAMPELAGRWADRLRSLLAAAGESVAGAAPSSGPTTEEQRQQLRSLGYLAGSGGASIDATLPDPREMVDLHETINRAATLLQEGKCAEAIPALEGVLRRSPHNAPALNLVGQCRERRGELEQALVAFRAAGQVMPRSGVPVANVARCLAGLGRRSEAESEYRRALSLDPSIAEATASLAHVLRDRGDGSGARQVLDRALALGVRHPAIYLERGLSLATAGELLRAEADFRESCRRDPANPVPLENLARAVYLQARYREAAVQYEQLARLQPERPDVWKTLGAVYLYKLDSKGEALRCFRSALRVEPDAAERANLEELIASVAN
ncbi:MAG: sulfatase-like hydrolase/transferase [Acidobacteriota bacterium]